ncbi:hypothetical protein [Flavobacterium sp.]|uniref:hypothetical protein n=1 Tax=Flavobacterium sp. TaxID=239 RepID=UPI0022BAEC80|nr:hypothetical protein [Flavobacterium sp.]MCZ8089039.1 hypothetical protein [Flavobacterium sp.]
MNKEELLRFLKLANSLDTFSNIDDIRSITINAIFKQIENLYFSVILSKNLNDIEFLKKNISEKIEENYINDIIINYEGFIKDAFFMKFFMIVENHINQIAEFYENSNNKIKDFSSIQNTFENLTTPKKCSLFTEISQKEKELFKFYCYLRNTNHKLGFQSKSNKELIIKDESSVINIYETKINLLKDCPNNLNTNSLLLIKEQILKLIIKINSKIPEQDYIEHILVHAGYNNH